MRSPLMASGCDDRRFRGNAAVLQMTGRGNHGVRIGAGTIRRHPVVSRLRSLEDRWESGENSGLAQQDPAHAVPGVLAQCQGGPLASRGDALPQIHQVHALPDLGGGYGDAIADRRVALEVGARLFERDGLEREEPDEMPASNILGVGVPPTPAIAHPTAGVGIDLGVMISASHNPFQDNGIEFFARGGHKLEDSVEDRIEGLPGCIGDLLTGAGVGRVVEGEIVADQRCISHLVDSGTADVPGPRIV